MRYDIYQTERDQAQTLENGLKVRKYERNGFPCLQIWRPKALKPHINYRMRSEEQREEYIQREINAHNEHLKRVNEYKEKRKPILEISKNLQKGEIFYTSWGYDQTNYDYIVIMSLSPSGKTCKCQRTSCLHMGESCQSNVQEPIFMPFGEVFTMQIRTGHNGGISLVGSYPFCHTGTGSKRLGYFGKHIDGAQYHETMSQFGH